MSKFYVDILEPNEDLNVALDELGKNIGPLYQEARININGLSTATNLLT